MIFSRGPEPANFIDHFWLEHGEQIRAIKELIKSPKTMVGEEIQKSAFNSPIFIVFNRLSPIFSSLITLIEYDEISQVEGKKYFSGSLSQRIVLKAIKLLIEDEIEFPYSDGEKRKYEDYRTFFEGIIRRLNDFERQVKNGHVFPNFVNSLVIIFSQEVNNLKGVENFEIRTGKIRGKIKEYLPELARVEQGKIFAEIKSLLENTLIS